MNTIIFDIDGTLVQSYEFDSRFYIQAIRDTVGDVVVHRDWAGYRHVTDSGILQEVLENHGIREHSSYIPQVRRRFLELIEGHFEEKPCTPVPGAVEMLESFREHPEWRVGLATGGWRATASAKLRSAGVAPENHVIYTSDEHHERTEIMKLCLAGLNGSSERVVYVGDGTWDLKATAELGWAFVAVGPRLKGAHTHWVHDFKDPNWPTAPWNALRRSMG